jgi:hypothetical protein
MGKDRSRDASPKRLQRFAPLAATGAACHYRVAEAGLVARPADPFGHPNLYLGRACGPMPIAGPYGALRLRQGGVDDELA